MSPHGFWSLVGDRERFVSFAQFPWFRHATIGELSNVTLPSLASTLSGIPVTACDEVVVRCLARSRVGLIHARVPRMPARVLALRDGRFQTAHASLLRESANPRRLIVSWGVG